MMTAAPTISPSSVRRRAFTPRRARREEDRRVSGTAGSLSAAVSRAGEPSRSPAGRSGRRGSTMRRRCAARIPEAPAPAGTGRDGTGRGSGSPGPDPVRWWEHPNCPRPSGQRWTEAVASGPVHPTSPGERTGAGGDVPLVRSTARFANRELSWLDFADRLLDLAADERQTPARTDQIPGASSPKGSTSSSRCAWPGSRTRWRQDCGPARPTGSVRPSSSRPSPACHRPGGPPEPRSSPMRWTRRCAYRSRDRPLGRARRGRPRPPGRRVRAGRSSRSSRPWRSIRATPSPTSRTCASTSCSGSPIRPPTNSASPG